jgi:hypothetical protein
MFPKKRTRSKSFGTKNIAYSFEKHHLFDIDCGLWRVGGGIRSIAKPGRPGSKRCGFTGKFVCAGKNAVIFVAADYHSSGRYDYAR